MIWYTFDMTGLPESMRLSLTRAFMRASQRESLPGDSHFYAACDDHEATPATYYLCTSEERIFTRLIRQFGGRRCAPPPPAQRSEIQRGGGCNTPVREPDNASC